MTIASFVSPKINGAWRFFDSNAKTVEELDAALKREAKGEISEDQLVVRRSAATGGCCRFRDASGSPVELNRRFHQSENTNFRFDLHSLKEFINANESFKEIQRLYAD